MKSPQKREERKQKMLGINNPMKNKEISSKVSVSLLGRKLSTERKIKMSLRMKGNQYNKGKQNNKGKHWILTDEQREKYGNKGIDNHNWKGGISKLNNSIRQLKEYHKWQSFVFQRDNWTCQTCRKRGCYLEIHHIKELYKIIKENNLITIEDALYCKELWSIDNGITLCKGCHNLTKRGRKHD